MFVWRADVILAEIGRQMPQLDAALAQISSAWGTPRQGDVLQSVWPGLKPETVDYGIMEHAKRVVVVPAGGLGVARGVQHNKEHWVAARKKARAEGKT